MLEASSEFTRRGYNLKTVITEECCDLMRVEVICFTAKTSFPLLTLTYNKLTDNFILTIERKFITQHSTLKALIEALRSVEEVVRNDERRTERGVM